MKLVLEPRPQPSRLWSALSPLLALLLTMLLGAVLFGLSGTSPLQGLAVFFVEPLKNAYAWGEIALKATPLLLIALGLGLCFRSNIWNIGAEGQFVLGAIASGWVALQAQPGSGPGFIVLILLAGSLGGMAWAAIVALLRDRFNTNEILVSLMLVYVAIQLLNYLVYGPWKDPAGYNFPRTASFDTATQLPRLMSGARANAGLWLALAACALMWLFMFRTRAGFAQQVGGLAPAAARYAGFPARRALWTALLLSGALAGLAGALDVIGPVGQLNPQIPVGYGFTAIIVAFVGRLHPVGMVFSSVLLSMLVIGGELSQSQLGLPKSLSNVFQGLLLFCLLACDTLINYRLRLKRAPVDGTATPASATAPNPAAHVATGAATTSAHQGL
ncbi:ABC transporter permease [Vandammella animalimorsus]|uniref:ABC transporter permease n=1 Tax=Vandammella animalimorsus TaxID=2029117 RepID=UPI0031B9FEF4